MNELTIMIILLSFVQSIFGVGILLFGTPSLLLFGYSYSETLWILLPCSLVISFVQIITSYDKVQVKKKAIFFTIPIMLVCLTFVVRYSLEVDISKIIGFFLIFIGIIKFSPRAQQLLKYFIEKKLNFYYMFIGFVHGVSNMGGGPLSVLMSTIYSDKVIIRANTAFIYLVFATFQLTILYIINPSGLSNIEPLLIFIVLLVYFVGNRYFANKINDKKYILIINLLILVYGILALTK
jgi:uncharacterized protein